MTLPGATGEADARAESRAQPWAEGGAAVFLDRDGVLNRVVMREGRPASPRSLDEFAYEPGVAEALTLLRRAGLPLFVVTNQPDVRRGLLDPAVLDAIGAKLRAELPIAEIAACPHDDRDGCACRKPKPGMILDLAARWGVDPARSFMVGDQDRDMQCGLAAGCTTLQIEKPWNTGAGAHHRVSDLVEAAQAILAEAALPAPPSLAERAQTP